MMAISINADAAALAGLQIDFLQKLRDGQVALGDFQMFLNLSSADRANRFGDWKQARDEYIRRSPPPSQAASPEKFAFMDVDLDILQMPAIWSLDDFKNQQESEFFYYNQNLTEADHPTSTSVAGKRYSVRACYQIVDGATTSLERLEFLESHGASYLGAQGDALVWNQNRAKLPKGKWYSSFSEGDLERARTGLGGGVPDVGARSSGHFDFDLGLLGDPWDQSDAFLCFCELPSDA